MDQTSSNVAQISKNLDIQEQQVTAAVKLLEAGNTIHFVTRYRKDETGGLGESKLSSIRQEMARLAALNERKASILQSLENQGKLNADLKSQIEQANQSRKLEDLYLPFKPKKTSLAETARQQGLEPLARDILEGHNPEVDLASRSTDFVRVDKGLSTVDEVIKGVQHILAEGFSENLKLRKQLRKLFWDKGEIQTELIPLPEPKQPPAEAKKPETPAAVQPTNEEVKPATNNPEKSSEDSANEIASVQKTDKPPTDTPAADIATTNEATATPATVEATAPAAQVESPATEAPAPAAQVKAPATEAPATAPPATAKATENPAVETTTTAALPAAAAELPATPDLTAAAAATATGDEAPKKKKKRKKKKKKKSAPDPFAEFKDFKNTLAKLAPHQTLAINRGERSKRVRSKMYLDPAKLSEVACEHLVPAEHPFAEFLRTVCDDAMQRLIVPSIEREIRRELTERAETHAVNVFAKNLKHLFLQPPVSGRRILGIDPGYRSGCKMAVIDERGQPVAHGVFSIVGNKERIESNKQRLIEMINQHQPQLVAIGNGSGCRVVEQFVSDIFANQLADRDLRYTIVNQAGTNSYSTSETGQRDLPDHDPVIRSAISIARRLQDPLSELVKVNPANIGVGMYQHDVKGKHLSDSLKQVVEYCVNFVGVDANSSNVSLLQHVSGLDEVTARKLVEHRATNGPFKNRQEFKQVAGLGDVTFVQSSGFLRVEDGDTPLDCTSIHPDDYEVSQKILAKLECQLEELAIPRYVASPASIPAPSPPEPADSVNTETVTVEADAKPAAESSADPAVPVEVTNSESAQAAVATASVDTVAATDAPATKTGSETTTEVATAPVVAVAPAKPKLSPAEFAEKKKRRNELVQKIKSLDLTAFAQELGVGEMKIRDLIRAIRNPLQDARSEMPSPVLRKGILKFEDLKPGVHLRGQIVNVVDFGVFLNIGIGESCLVHISRLANRFVRDPHWLYAVGDVLNVWVQEVDAEKRRVTLTAIRPESEKRDSRKRRSDRGSEGSEDRTRQSSGGPNKRYGGKGRPQNARKVRSYEKRSTRKPKPVTPISKEMVDGKKPMRSFSDLLQFHQKKKDGDSDKE